MPNTIDVTGLPDSVVKDIRQLVNTLRTRLGAGHETRVPSAETPQASAERFARWVESREKRNADLDDSRESIYGERGE